MKARYLLTFLRAFWHEPNTQNLRKKGPADFEVSRLIRRHKLSLKKSLSSICHRVLAVSALSPDNAR